MKAGSGHVMDANGWLQVIVQAVESDRSRAQRHVMRGSSGTFRDGWTPEGRRKRGRPRKSWLPWFQFEIREQPNGLSHAEKTKSRQVAGVYSIFAFLCFD